MTPTDKRKSPFDWTVGDRLDLLERLYRTEGRKAEEVAALIGCTRKAVVLKAARLGWGSERRQRRKDERVTPPRKVRRPPPSTQLTDEQLVAIALSQGRVRVLPVGRAAGLSSWERAAGMVAPAGETNYRNFRFGAKAA